MVGGHQRPYSRPRRGAGAAQPREGASATVAQLLERFAAAAVVKASTMAAYKQTTDSLRDFLGAATPLCDLTHSNADA